MQQLARGVIKQSRLVAGQPVKLPDLSGDSAAPAGGQGQPAARIVGREGNVAIVEVTCLCGRTIQLRCQCQ